MTDELRQIAKRIAQAGGRAFLVGGSVRDMVLGVEPKDFDVEVFDLDLDTLIAVLEPFGRVDTVGRSFGVVKLTTAESDFDFSQPRIDSKFGPGHTAFGVMFTDDPWEAARRRDFTINSMSIDILTGELFDFFGGQADIESRTLRATSPLFGDDPLRVLRGMQLSGRAQLTAVQETIEMCRDIVTSFFELSRERVWGEWEKWARKSVSPSFGLRFLRQTEWVGVFPHLWTLVDLGQDSKWHPEGDAWEHTCQAVDAAVEIAEREHLSDDDRLTLVFASLCHDMGKAETTTFDDDGHVRSRGHDEAGADMARSFMEFIGAPKWLVEKVVALVREHMFHVHVRQPTARSVRKLSVRVAPSSIRMLCFVMEADHSARAPLPGGIPEVCHRMMELAEAERCQEQEVQPFVMGRDLIGLGMRPGRHFGVILSALFKAQVAGVFKDKEGALSWAKEFV